MICWARYLLIALVSVLGVGQMIAACGQKGDLYLPKPETPKQSPIPAKGDDTPQIPSSGAEEAEKEDQDTETPATTNQSRN